jgi:hypothetical protein
LRLDIETRLAQLGSVVALNEGKRSAEKVELDVWRHTPEGEDRRRVMNQQLDG